MHNLHNYYSLTAILYGLKLAKFRSDKLSDLWPLIDNQQNYLSYRTAFAETGGVPFLFPHTWRVYNGLYEDKFLNLFSSNASSIVGQDAPVESCFETDGVEIGNNSKFWGWAEHILSSITTALRQCYKRNSA
jgi:hypothetical protein